MYTMRGRAVYTHPASVELSGHGRRMTRIRPPASGTLARRIQAWSFPPTSCPCWSTTTGMRPSAGAAKPKAAAASSARASRVPRPCIPRSDTSPLMQAEHVDVLIVGAGLSGVGAACHLEMESPGRTYAIFEARDAIGGTWDLFRYPGIRSDSDMFTLGYDFRPWEEGKAIADGPSIRHYIRETARDHDVERHIRFHHRVVRADWSSEAARWLVEAERTDTGETVRLTCSFL